MEAFVGGIVVGLVLMALGLFAALGAGAYAHIVWIILRASWGWV